MKETMPLIVLLASLLVFALYLIFRRPPVYFCASCCQMVAARKGVKGTVWIEIILWLCFLLPGIIYSIWRATGRPMICSMCKGTELLPPESPRARKLAAEYGQID